MTGDEPGSRLRVMPLVDSLGTSGGDRWVYDLGTRWASRGAMVTIFHLTGVLETARLRPPADLHVASGPHPERRLRRALLGALPRLLRETLRHDVIIVDTSSISAMAGYAAARLTHRKVVAYSQGLVGESLVLYQDRSYLRAVLRWCLVRMDAFFCVTGASAGAARELGVRTERIVEVRTGLDLDRVRALASDPRSEIGPIDHPTVVNVGTLEWRKGQDLLIRTVAELVARDRPVHAVIVGPDGGRRAELEGLARSLGVDHLVRFPGYLDNPLPLIATADVYVHTAHSEIVGLTMLESLAVGTPVVAFDCAAGGPRLVLEGGRYGRLVATESPEALADAIVDTLQARVPREALAAEAEMHIRHDFSPETAADRGYEALTRLCAGTRRTHLIGSSA